MRKNVALVLLVLFLIPCLAFADVDFSSMSAEELLQLQQEWKSIGATNRKVSEKVWQRFRGACDEFFARKREFYSDFKNQMQDNLIRKLQLC